MMVFELMCGKLYCGGRCYMSYAGSPVYIRTHKDVQNLTEAKYPCSERRLVLMDAVLYFAMRDHLPFAEPVPHLEEHHRLFLVSYISMVEKLMVILRRYFDENVPRTQRAAESWVKLQTPIANLADVDSSDIVRRTRVLRSNSSDVTCRLSSANIWHGVFEQIKPLP